MTALGVGETDQVPCTMTALGVGETKPVPWYYDCSGRG